MAKKKDWHAQGEKDCLAGKYKLPRDSIEVLFGGASKEDLENNKAYKAGWQNAKKQKR